MKTCKRCGETKPLSLYQPHPTGKDGHCSNCNTLLGKAKDNVNILQAAIDYLNDFSS